jgi:hypothetical protein
MTFLFGEQEHAVDLAGGADVAELHPNQRLPSVFDSAKQKVVSLLLLPAVC